MSRLLLAGELEPMSPTIDGLPSALCSPSTALARSVSRAQASRLGSGVYHRLYADPASAESASTKAAMERRNVVMHRLSTRRLKKARGLVNADS